MTNRGRLRDVAGEIEPPRGLTPDDVERDGFERVRFTLFMAVVAEAIPRRLGRDADGAALALDKRIARMVANGYRSLWMGYAKLGRPAAPAWSSRDERVGLARDAEPAMRRAGATVIWARWFPDRADELLERRRAVAALALSKGLNKWGTRHVRILTAELENIERIADETIRRTEEAA